MNLPATLSLNAFTGDDVEVSGAVAPRGNRWGSSSGMLTRQAPLAPGVAARPGDWAHEDVGWGVVLPDDDARSARDKARAVDAAEPIRDLIGARGDAPVFRFRPDLGFTKLARYFEDGTRQDPEIGLSDFGVAKGRLPLYLLIVGSPGEIPWQLQYALNRRHHVGRLDLPPEGLANYISALIADWDGMEPSSTNALVWSVNYDTITQKMDATIASLIDERMQADNELAATRLIDDGATRESLLDALTATRPAVIVTSSHGKTGPLGNRDEMRRDLGLPVDANRAPLDVDTITRRWSPGGAVWYAQACCSAGSSNGTSYDGLLEPDSLAHRVVSEIGHLGAMVAPLPTRLLGAPQPLRAFVGHVEPTFDWTLIAGDTGQFLTGPLVDAVYPNLYRRCPLGLAFRGHYAGVGELYAKLARALADINDLVDGARDAATYYRLTASDRESLVLLGDPTVAVPPLPSHTAAGSTPADCSPEV